MTSIEKLATNKFDLNVTIAAQPDPKLLMMQGVLMLISTREEDVATPNGVVKRKDDKIDKKITQVVCINRTDDMQNDLLTLQNRLIDRLVEVAGL